MFMYMPGLDWKATMERKVIMEKVQVFIHQIIFSIFFLFTINYELMKGDQENEGPEEKVDGCGYYFCPPPPPRPFGKDYGGCGFHGCQPPPP